MSEVKVSNRQVGGTLRIIKLLFKIRAEVAESEAILTSFMQVATQEATVAVMALREADAGATSGTSMASSGEAHIYRHGRPALRQ